MEDLTGKRFGKLVALRPGEKSKSGRVRWVCRCDCGNEKLILAHCLKNGETKSCGCEHYKSAPRKDLTGLKFGRLTVLSYAGKSYWNCRCECGKLCSVLTYSLHSGQTKSCGCLCSDISAERATSHGGSRDPLYAVLRAMHQRCENPNSKDFIWYGAKGVTVCEEWSLSNYPAFRAWAEANGYAPGLTIDRIDPTGAYSPDNCRWISIQAQQRNKRKSKRIDAYAHD